MAVDAEGDRKNAAGGAGPSSATGPAGEPSGPFQARA